MRWWCRGFIVVAAWALVTTTASAESTIFVGAAASLRNPLVEIQREYEKRSPGSKLRFSFGPSHMLARQIRMGAPIEVFLSADEQILDELESLELIEAGSRFSWLENRLVILRAPESAVRISAPVDLTRREVERIAIASDAAPVGRYARQWLRAHRLESQLESRIVVTEHARATRGAVELGHADVAIVYATDARLAKRAILAYEIPDAEQPRIRYGAARITAGSHPDAAKNFVAFLRSPAARAILTRHGFVVLGSAS
jgi:molybdate transport system substrate-binding protein